METGRNDENDRRGVSSASSLDAIDILVLLVLAACGWGLWVWADSQTDAEAWDHNSFWSVVLPAMAVLSAVAGWLRPSAAVWVGLALVVPQAITLFATSGIGPLAIVGLLFFAVFVGGFTAIARIAARVRIERAAAKRS